MTITMHDKCKQQITQILYKGIHCDSNIEHTFEKLNQMDASPQMFAMSMKLHDNVNWEI